MFPNTGKQAQAVDPALRIWDKCALYPYPVKILSVYINFVWIILCGCNCFRTRFSYLLIFPISVCLLVSITLIDHYANMTSWSHDDIIFYTVWVNKKYTLLWSAVISQVSNIYMNACNIWLEYILLHLLIRNLWV